MVISQAAGLPASTETLVDLPRLVTASFTQIPDPSRPAQGVAFGTSGHRGSSFDRAFNEWRILAISQAICRYRVSRNISLPLFLGIDTQAVSAPALVTAVEVRAANGVELMLAQGDEVTPNPVASRATLACNRGRKSGFADGNVITPSHNPPDDGGFTYNSPNGGPADTSATRWIEAAAEPAGEKKTTVLAKATGSGARRILDEAQALVNDALSAEFPPPPGSKENP